jgi:hypothetical protein
MNPQQGYQPYQGVDPYASYHNHAYQQHGLNVQLPFLESLDLPNLYWLTNDLIYHFPTWPHIPAKLPSYIDLDLGAEQID